MSSDSGSNSGSELYLAGLKSALCAPIASTIHETWGRTQKAPCDTPVRGAHPTLSTTRSGPCAPAACDPCGPVVAKPLTTTCRVWVPKIVQRKVEYTAYECQAHQEDYEYEVTVCKPRNVTKKVKVFIITEVKNKDIFVKLKLIM